MSRTEELPAAAIVLRVMPMFESIPAQLQLPGIPLPSHSLQELADAQRAFLTAFENYQRLLDSSGPVSIEP